MEQPAAANDLAAPLSDDDFRRLFNSDSPAASDSELYESGLPLDFLDGGDMPTFAFDSLVDFDPEPVHLDSSVVGLSEESAQQTSSMQPSHGASTSRCDGQSIAASG
jgi:transcriptional activator HAC1